MKLTYWPENDYIIYYKLNGYRVAKEIVNTKTLTEAKHFLRDVYIEK